MNFKLHYIFFYLITLENKQQRTALNFCNDEFGQWKSGIPTINSTNINKFKIDISNIFQIS